MVKVSVIVPVYNAEQYLKPCMDSLCCQTLREMEIICVDDGSTDRSLQILNEYAGKDCRIKVITQKNQYAGIARNHGMGQAEGQYLAFLDADDKYHHEMLEEMYQKAETDKSDIVISRYLFRDEFLGKEICPDWSFLNAFLPEKNTFSGKELKYAGIFQITRGWAWDKLFRTDFVRRCGYVFPDFRSSEDGFFTYMLLARAGRISYMNDIFVTHRINQPASLSSTKEPDWRNGFKMLRMIKEELEKQDLYGTYRQSFLNEAVGFLKWYLDSMHTPEAYRNCYDYIKTRTETEMGILSRGRGYYFQEDLYDWYRTLQTVSMEEYLFQERERNLVLLAEKERQISRQQETIQEKGWLCPFHLMEKDRTVVLYGAGRVGKSWYRQLSDSGFCREIIWVDRQYAGYAARGMDVRNPEIIFQREFDYILVALKEETARKEVLEWLAGHGTSQEKMVFSLLW